MKGCLDKNKTRYIVIFWIIIIIAPDPTWPADTWNMQTMACCTHQRYIPTIKYISVSLTHKHTHTLAEKHSCKHTDQPESLSVSHTHIPILQCHMPQGTTYLAVCVCTHVCVCGSVLQSPASPYHLCCTVPAHQPASPSHALIDISNYAFLLACLLRGGTDSHCLYKGGEQLFFWLRWWPPLCSSGKKIQQGKMLTGL